VTGNINSETEIVKVNGGRVVYTDDITFSSSSLINSYLDVHEPVLKRYLGGLREIGMVDRFAELLSIIQDYKVVMVGDAIIDEYTYVEPLGKSPKENMIATLFKEKEIFAGGIIAAANHVAEFCAEVEVVCCLGEGKEGYEDFIRSTLKPNVILSPIIRKDIPTTRKCRFIDMGYEMRKLFEVYFMDDKPLEGSDEAKFIELISGKLAKADLTVVTDFGHGVITNNIVKVLCERSNFLTINAQSNSANLGFNLVTKYPNADYICIDQPEARLAVRDNHADIETIVSDLLPKQINCSQIIVTGGKNGCFTFDRTKGFSQAPALTTSIIDTVGAGDAFFVVSAPFVKAGATMEEAAFIGNVAGGMKVGIIGHRQSVEKVPFQKYVTALLK